MLLVTGSRKQPGYGFLGPATKIAALASNRKCSAVAKATQVVDCAYKLDRVEKDFIDVQVPLNEIELAIARWKEEEQTSTTTFVAISELVVLMVILVW